MNYRTIIFTLIVVCITINGYCSKSLDSLRLLISRSVDTSKVRHVNNIAALFVKNSAFDSALSYAQTAIDLQREFEYPKEYIVSYGIITNVLYYKGNYNSSRDAAFKGFKVADKMNDGHFKILFLKSIANTYERQGKTELALDYYLRGLSITEQEKDSMRMGELYSELGEFYTKINNFDMSLVSQRKSLGIFLSKLRSDSISFKYNTLAICYSNMGNLMVAYFTHKFQSIAYVDSALIYYNKGIAIARKINDANRLGILLINTSDAYNMQGNYTKAIDLLMEASEIYSKTENYGAKIATYVNLGDAYRGLNNVDISIQNLKKAIELAKKAGAKLFASESYLSLSKTYEKANNYNEAFYSYKAYNNYKDSVLDLQSSGAISEMVTQYETDKKEAEIELLKKDTELQQHEIGKQKVVRNIVSLGLLLIITLSFLLYNRYRLSKKINSDLDKNNSLIYNKNRLIMDSIDYAQRIQNLILPPLTVFDRHFADSFTVYIPKDVISGDIYWFTKRENKLLFAAVDCTGHGVPGAFMSMVAYNLLNRAANPGESLDAISVITNVNRSLKNFVAQSIDKSNVRDGMDIALCSLDLNTLQLSFAGAQNSAYIVRNKELTELKGEQVSMGDPAYSDYVFTGSKTQLQKGDWLYLATDGYADQKGGSNNKKYYYQPLKDLVTGISDLSGAEQKQKLEDVFNEWKGKSEQLDDVLIIAVKI